MRMKRAMKAVFILLAALTVFTGALMIAEGLRAHQGAGIAVTTVISGQPEASSIPDLFDNIEGSAI